MTEQRANSGFYPAFLDLRGRNVVVIGGGEVALRKIESLLATGAVVKVIAPEMHPEIEELFVQGAVAGERRPYARGDLAGAMLAIAATSDADVNRLVSEEAMGLNLFLNVVDSPSASTFIVPSVIRRDDLTLAISTGGLSPALAKRIREKLEETLVPEYGAFLRLLGSLRARVRRELPLPDQREIFWTEVVNSDAFEVYRISGQEAARSRVEEILHRIREGEPWIVVVGLNHKIAPVEIREQFCLTGDQINSTLDGLATVARERVVLSTCNRLEVYAVAERSVSVVAEIKRFLRAANCQDLPEEHMGSYFFDFHNEEAARHLFAVASGVDSMILGEPQILGQVRDAYDLACQRESAGSVLSSLFQRALSVGKRARTETSISRSAASVSHAAVELAKQIFGEITSRVVLVVGAGEMGELAAKNLVDNGVRRVMVANRTHERALELVARIGGTAIPWDSLGLALAESDIVITSTGSSHTIFRPELVSAAMRSRRGRSLFFVDIAVPRDVDPAVGAMDNVYLYDIDDLQSVVAANLREREKEVSRVLAIVDEEVDEFAARLRGLEVVPTIAALRKKAEEVRRLEMEHYSGRLNLGPRERNAVEALTQAIVNKLLHTPTVRLKAQASDGARGQYVDVVKELFDLGDGGPA